MRKKFAKLKMVELSTSIMSIWWGFILLLPLNSFDASQAYEPLKDFAPELVWGIGMLLIGMMQLLAVMYDKTKIRELALITATGAWAFIATMFAMGDIASTATGIYAVVSIMTAWAYVKVKAGEK